MTEERIEAILGFDRVRKIISDRCSTEYATARTAEENFSTDAREIRQRLLLTDEMRMIVMFEESFPSNGYIDCVRFLEILSNEGSNIDLVSLGKLKTMLETLRRITLFFSNIKDGIYPNLKKMVSSIVLFPEVQQRIDTILDKFGNVKDTASDELYDIRRKLKEFVNRPFQKKEGTRYEIFRDEELPLLAKLPATPYELAEWKQATVQFNYHISVDGMLYSVPYEFIKRKVDVRVTDTVIEIFYNHNRIASHRRLYGRKGQYSTVTEHMPADHQAYLEWNGDRFRKWAERIGTNTCKVVNAILASQRVEQQSYRSCTGLLKLADKYSDQRLEAACRKALSYTASSSYKSIKNILAAGQDNIDTESQAPNATSTQNKHAITRGADYYRR